MCIENSRVRVAKVPCTPELPDLGAVAALESASVRFSEFEFMAAR